MVSLHAKMGSVSYKNGDVITTTIVVIIVMKNCVVVVSFSNPLNLTLTLRNPAKISHKFYLFAQRLSL